MSTLLASVMSLMTGQHHIEGAQTGVFRDPPCLSFLTSHRFCQMSGGRRASAVLRHCCCYCLLKPQIFPSECSVYSSG